MAFGDEGARTLAALRALKEQGGGDIYVIGSTVLVRTLVETTSSTSTA